MSGMTTASVIGLGLAAASTAMTIAEKASKRGAAQDNRSGAIGAVLSETVPSVNRSLAQSYNSNSARAIQEADKTATEAFDITRAMAEAKSTATVAAGEAGVGGNSFANVLGDFEMREGLARGKMDYNYKTKVQQITDENEANKNKAQGQINSAINSAVLGTPIPPGGGFMEIGAAAAPLGVKIADLADKKGWFDSSSSVDPNTGRSIDSEIAEWSKY